VLLDSGQPSHGLWAAASARVRAALPCRSNLTARAREVKTGPNWKVRSSSKLSAVSRFRSEDVLAYEPGIPRGKAKQRFSVDLAAHHKHLQPTTKNIWSQGKPGLRPSPQADLTIQDQGSLI